MVSCFREGSGKYEKGLETMHYLVKRTSKNLHIDKGICVKSLKLLHYRGGYLLLMLLHCEL